MASTTARTIGSWTSFLRFVMVTTISVFPPCIPASTSFRSASTHARKHTYIRDSPNRQ